MVKLRSAMLAFAAAVSFAGEANAQVWEWRTMPVGLPDGSTAEIRYVGDVPPQVTYALIPPPDYGDLYECYDAFGYFGHYSPCFRHRLGHHGKHRNEFSPNAVVLHSLPPGFVVPSNAAPGSRYHYALISTAPDGGVCTQRTEWQSRGRRKEPLITRTDVGEGCAALAGPPPRP